MSLPRLVQQPHAVLCCAVEEMLPYTASPALAVSLLDNFLWLLQAELDVTKVCVGSRVTFRAVV